MDAHGVGDIGSAPSGRGLVLNHGQRAVLVDFESVAATDHAQFGAFDVDSSQLTSSRGFRIIGWFVFHGADRDLVGISGFPDCFQPCSPRAEHVMGHQADR